MMLTVGSQPYADAPRLPEGEVVSPAHFLGAKGPVELEIGPGRGGFILERLQNDPLVRIFGLEIRRKWATIVDRRLTQMGYGDRGRVFAEDARYSFPRLPSESLSRIYVHFPDPWWKKRHRKRLLASEDLADAASRLLISGGEFFAQTDVEERALLYRGLFEAHPDFEEWQEGPWAEDPDYGARSPRERRAMLDELPIFRVRFRRRAR
ncbi:MAG: tRNA (guanine-N7-)-methyltransferase [Pseudomonadota bacterium]|jgi:tRNA (guanine-N7-)-methyltransferase